MYSQANATEGTTFWVYNEMQTFDIQRLINTIYFFFSESYTLKAITNLGKF